MTHAKQQIKERPIRAYMHEVQAILAGRQSQLRRPIKPQPFGAGQIFVGRFNPLIEDRDGLLQLGPEIFGAYDDFGEWGVKCPYGRPGDRLWLKETFCDYDPAGFLGENKSSVCYRADGGGHCGAGPYGLPWKPSIHMPRAASRILLETTRIRVERLQEISEEDAIAEGVLPQVWHDEEAGGQPVTGYENYLPEGYVVLPTAKESFASLIKSIYGPGFWDRNDWMWVVDFKRIEL